MFKLKILVLPIIFLFLLIITSIIKNQTRIIEKKLYKLNKKILLKEKNINESQLDFYFLTSPAEIEKKIIILSQNHYSPIQNSKIFLSLSDFTDVNNKMSIFNNYDKKEKKNN